MSFVTWKDDEAKKSDDYHAVHVRTISRGRASVQYIFRRGTRIWTLGLARGTIRWHPCMFDLYCLPHPIQHGSRIPPPGRRLHFLVCRFRV